MFTGLSVVGVDYVGNIAHGRGGGFVDGFHILASRPVIRLFGFSRMRFSISFGGKGARILKVEVISCCWCGWGELLNVW